MERGVYFDGWFRQIPCYHPSLPERNLQMLDDLERFHATALCWAGMGGGSLSLPYLQHEAFGPVDPRMQIYGYMNDSEFIKECEKRGIRLYAIVFEAQGWEYPAVIGADGKIVRLNKRAEEIKDHTWYGLREFGEDKYPDAFPTSLSDYYPDGIKNENGDTVTDLWEECAVRDMYGNPVHAQWVEVKGHEEQCYQMCRNNPVWREYLKKIIQLQLDAGASGIQLDECEVPMTAISSGGCFCNSCMRQFRQYLTEKRNEGTLGEEWNGIETETFDYGSWLREHGCTFPKDAPFYRDYWEFQLRAVKKHFSELADHARKYAMEKYSRKIFVSGNFYNMQPAYYPIEDKVDTIVTEMDHTLFRQPYYYRFCSGFASGKPVIVAENPYGGIIPRLLEMLDRGKGYDLYRVFLLEASVYGCNMSVPYGGWMGNTVRDAFMAPRALTQEIQDFLYRNEELYPVSRSGGAAVLYSYAGYYWRDSSKGSGANGMQDAYESLMDATADTWTDPDMKPVPFWDVIRGLSEANRQYDVVMLPDGMLRQDSFSEEKLEGYPVVVLPDDDVLTENQCRVIERYAKKGGKVLILGRAGEKYGLTEKLMKTGNAVYVPLEAEYMPAFMKAFDEMYVPFAPVLCDNVNAGIQCCVTADKTAVHILNYAYSEREDRIMPIPELVIRVKGMAGRKPEVLVPGKDRMPETETADAGEDSVVTVRNAGLYTVLVFEKN